MAVIGISCRIGRHDNTLAYDKGHLLTIGAIVLSPTDAASQEAVVGSTQRVVVARVWAPRVQPYSILSSTSALSIRIFGVIVKTQEEWQPGIHYTYHFHRGTGHGFSIFLRFVSVEAVVT